MWFVLGRLKLDIQSQLIHHIAAELDNPCYSVMHVSRRIFIVIVINVPWQFIPILYNVHSCSCE